MELLDTTIVNIAGPSIAPVSAAAKSTVQWLSASYTLASAVLIFTAWVAGRGRYECCTP
jgi:MFS family permease